MFDVTTGSALLARTVTTNPNLNDIISADVTLNDSLNVSLPWLGNTNGIQMTGVISSANGITKISPITPATALSNAQFLDLTNLAKSFTRNVEVANGTVVFRGDVLPNNNGALGNSAAAVKISTAASLGGTGTPTLANSTTVELRLQASNETANYTFARGLDFPTRPEPRRRKAPRASP